MIWTRRKKSFFPLLLTGIFWDWLTELNVLKRSFCVSTKQKSVQYRQPRQWCTVCNLFKTKKNDQNDRMRPLDTALAIFFFLMLNLNKFHTLLINATQIKLMQLLDWNYQDFFGLNTSIGVDQLFASYCL